MQADPRSTDDASLALAEDLRAAVSRFVHAVRRRTDGARSAQSETLALLAREGDLNVAGLAARRHVSHQTMRVVVALLSAEGLVEDRPDPADGRSRLLALTARGREAVESERRTRAAGIAALIENTLSDAERRTLQAAAELLVRLSEAAARQGGRGSAP